MAERSYPREWIGLLPAEAERWVQQGLISADQRDAIVKLYPSAPAESRDRTTLILSVLGSLLLGAGVILFFASNWPLLPVWLRLGVLLGAVAGSYWGGYHLAHGSANYPRLGQSLILLGAILYGASIWLVAQMFHLDSHYPNGFFMWAAGLLPLAWVVEPRPVLYLSTVLLGIWTVMEQVSFDAANYLYPVLVLGALLPLSRRLHTALGEAGVLTGVFLWLSLNVARVGGDMEGIWQLMAILYGTALVLGGLARLGDPRPMLGVGGAVLLGGCYFLTFDLYGGQVEAVSIATLFQGPLFNAIVAGLLLAAMPAGAYLYVRRSEPWRQVILPAAFLPLAGALLLPVLGDVGRMVLFNLVLFAGTVGMVVLGVQRRMELLVNLGLIIFVIHTITRYVDLFFTAMNKSLFFMLGGVLLIGGGWLLERNRRRWVGEIGGGSHDA